MIVRLLALILCKGAGRGRRGRPVARIPCQMPTSHYQSGVLQPKSTCGEGISG